MSNHRRSTSSVAVARVLTLALLIALLMLAGIPLNSDRSTPRIRTGAIRPESAPFSLRANSPRYSPRGARPLFPYSVVPGGVESPQELTNAMGNDPTVAQHYAGFRLAAAHVVSLDKDFQAYVSYRIGEQIFWTKKPVTLHKNETVITDGTMEARTRCGNRVSATPQLPLSAQEPAPEALEEAQVSDIPDGLDAPFDLPMNLPSPAGLIAAEHSFNETGHEPLFTPPGGPGGWGGFPPFVPGGSPPPSYPEVPPPPVPTPEPGTGLCLLLALSAAWLFRETRAARRPPAS